MSKKTPKQRTLEESRADDIRTTALLLTMADTTWRMFVPPAIFVFGGLYGDTLLHTKPWLTLIAAPVGLGISALLIKRQIGSAE